MLSVSAVERHDRIVLTFNAALDNYASMFSLKANGCPSQFGRSSFISILSSLLYNKSTILVSIYYHFTSVCDRIT